MYLLLEGDAVADGPQGVLHHALLKIHKHRGKSFPSGNFNITHTSIFSGKYSRGLQHLMRILEGLTCRKMMAAISCSVALLAEVVSFSHSCFHTGKWQFFSASGSR
jgi:hypothetical protein